MEPLYAGGGRLGLRRQRHDLGAAPPARVAGGSRLAGHAADEVVDLLETMRHDNVRKVTAIVPLELPLSALDRWPSVADRGRLDRTGLRIVVLRQ